MPFLKDAGMLSGMIGGTAKDLLTHRLAANLLDSHLNRLSAKRNRILSAIRQPTPLDEPDDERTPLPVLKQASGDDYQSDSSGQSAGPPHLRQSSNPSESCAACKSFDKMGNCLKYNSPVSPDMTCDGFEQIDIDTKAISSAGPVQPAKPIMPASNGPNFGSLKLSSFLKTARYRPNIKAQTEEWLSRITHHPDSYSGSIHAPMHVAFDAMDKPRPPSLVVGNDHPQNMMPNHDSKDTNKLMHERDKMNTKEAFKAGFLLRCAEEGLTLDQLEQRVEKLLEKKALGETLGGLVGGALSGLGTAAVGVPILGGGLLGYAAAKSRLGAPNVDDIKHNEMRNEYLRLADAAKRRTTLRQMKEQSPGSIVQIA